MLQSELKSCKELQELEPENKCEALFPEILLLAGSPFLCLLGGRSRKGLNSMGAKAGPGEMLLFPPSPQGACSPSSC